MNRAGLQPYPNLPAKLVDDGTINTNAYSLWLNDLDASTGSILFGGVDTDKFKGTLQKLPIIQERGQYAEFIIALTGMGQNGQENSIFTNDSVAVLLDSGSSLMYLPDNVAQSLYQAYGAQYDSSQGAAFVDCNLGNQKGSLDFSFSGVTISVDMSELVITAGFQRGRPICILGVSPAGDSLSVLGDTFLRSAYVVYDLSNNQIGLAQTNFNVSASNIKEITTGSSGIPSATLVPNAVSTAAVNRGGGRVFGPAVTITSAGAMPAVTGNPWHTAGVVAAGAGALLGFNGF